ncbi:MAG TPA: peptidylprolyl isomerase [Longimicrobiales bacterium]|nr:peptidylprolyl isomerase [Longimicrobiales bacterium]
MDAPVAVAGGDTLSVEALSNWLVLGQPLPVTVEFADGLAHHWVEMAALGTLGPERLRSPEVVDAVTWPAYRAAILDARIEDHLGPPPAPTPAEVEAVYAGDLYRLPARILRRASPEAHPEERERQRQVAFEIRQALTRGAGWPEAVARSEDELSVPRSGLLGLVRSGELPPGLDRVVFQLRPGEISQVLETEEGFQVVYRPRLEDIREIFAEELRTALQEERRRAFVDSLAAVRALGVAADGAERLIRLADGSAHGTGEDLATWEGGELADTAALRYLGTLAPEDRARLARGAVPAARALLLEIARQEMTWAILGDATAEAGPAEDGSPEDARDRAGQSWLATVDEVEAVLGPGHAGAVGPSLEAYMEAVVARRRTPVAVPPTAMSTAARMVQPLSVERDGVAAAVERARRLLSAGDGPA